MKNLNKVFAMLLVVAMMMTSVVFADFSDVADDAAYAEAVNVGVALGLFTGYEDGTFQPEGNITRAEFAAMVVRALNQESQAKSAATAATVFPDVAADHWAKGYINVASKKGIINGYEDGTFRPENNVTFEEAVKMLVVAIGHEPEVGAAGYPLGYLTVADDYDITDDAMGVVGEAATRGLVAQLLLNSMDTPLMEKVGYGAFLDYQVNDGYDDTARETLLSENHDIVKLRVTVKTSSLLSGSNANDEEYVTVDILNTYASKYTESEFKDAYGNYLTGYQILAGETDISELVGKNAIVYARYNPKSQEDAVAVYASIDTTKTYELTVSSADVASVVCPSCTGSAHLHDDAAITFNYYKAPTDKKATSVTINKDADLYINGVLVSTSSTVADDIIDELEDAYGTITFQRLNRTTVEDYDTIFITNYETYVVESVSATRFKVYSKNNGNFTYYDEDGAVVATLVDATGAEMAWEDLKENDIISVVKSVGSKTVIKAELLTATVAGSVTGVSADEDEYVIAGETYAVDGINVDPGDIALGDEGTFFLDAMGNICYYDTTAELNTNYAVIVKVGTNGSNLDTKTAIKVFTYDGQFGTMQTASKVKLDGISNIPSASLSADYTLPTVKTVAETAKLVEKYGKVNYQFADGEDATPDTDDDVVAKVNALAAGDIITFKTNAAGEITEITRAFVVNSTNGNEGKFTKFNGEVDLTYNEKSESFSGAASKLYVTDKTVIIVADLAGTIDSTIESKTEDDFSLFSVANIVDEQKLNNAHVYNVNEDKEVGFIFVTTETEAVDAAAIMALVTGKGTASDDEGNEIWNIKVLQDGLVKDGVDEDALVTDGSSDFGIVAYDTIVPKYNAAGEVKAADRLAWLSGSDVAFNDVKFQTVKNDTDSKVNYYYGAVSNIDRKEFTVNGTHSEDTSFTVDNATNVYVYNCLVNSKYAASIDSYDVVEFDGTQAYYGTTPVKVKVVAREFDEELIDLVIYILPNA